MDYSACDGSFIPESVAATFDVIAWLSRSYPGPSYEERCYLLAQKRAADRNTDRSLQALPERHHE